MTRFERAFLALCLTAALASGFLVPQALVLAQGPAARSFLEPVIFYGGTTGYPGTYSADFKGPETHEGVMTINGSFAGPGAPGGLSGNNTWTGNQTFSGALTANGAANFTGAVTATNGFSCSGSPCPGGLSGNNAWTGNQTFSGGSTFSGAVTATNGFSCSGGAGCPGLTGVVDVKAKYACAADGTTNDTTCLINAINAYNASARGEVLYLAPGNYSVTCSSLPAIANPGIIEGAGTRVTQITNRAGDTGSCIHFGSATFNPGHEGFLLQDLTLAGNGSDASGILISNPTNVVTLVFRHLTIEGFGGIGFDLCNGGTAQNSVYVYDTITANNGSWGLQVCTNDVHLYNVNATGNGSNGTTGNANISNGYAISWIGGGTSSVSACTTAGAGSCAELMVSGGHHVMLQNLYIQAQGTPFQTAHTVHAIETANVTDLQLIGNHLTCASTVTATGLYIGGSTTNMRVDGGEIDSCGGSPAAIITTNPQAGANTADGGWRFWGYRFYGGGLTTIQNNATSTFTIEDMSHRRETGTFNTSGAGVTTVNFAGAFLVIPICTASNNSNGGFAYVGAPTNTSSVGIGTTMVAAGLVSWECHEPW